MPDDSVPNELQWLLQRMKEAEHATPGHDYLIEPAREKRKPTPLGRQLQDLEYHTRSFLVTLQALRHRLATAIAHEEATAAQRAKEDPANSTLLAMVDTATWHLADGEESIHFALRFLLPQRATGCV